MNFTIRTSPLWTSPDGLEGSNGYALSGVRVQAPFGARVQRVQRVHRVVVGASKL